VGALREKVGMQNSTEIMKALAGMPWQALVALVILAAFGLAGYAIHAVASIAKGRRK
jgi:hypothetical protein